MIVGFVARVEYRQIVRCECLDGKWLIELVELYVGKQRGMEVSVESLSRVRLRSNAV